MGGTAAVYRRRAPLGYLPGQKDPHPDFPEGNHGGFWRRGTESAPAASAATSSIFSASAQFTGVNPEHDRQAPRPE